MAIGAVGLHRFSVRETRARRSLATAASSILTLGLLAACVAPPVNNTRPRADFATRCADPNVIRCIGFERDELRENGGPIAWNTRRAPVGTFVNGIEPNESLDGRVELTSEHSASGSSSLKFTMPSRSGAGYAGQFYANFSDDNSIQFGEGESFYIQWRQRFSRSFLDNRYRPRSNWKQAIIGEGDRPAHIAYSCTQLEIVVDHDEYGSPAMYHSCRGKDGRTERLFQNHAFRYEPDQWMTFQIVVRVGTWYRNDRRYRKDSLIELWVAREGESSRRVISGYYDLANTTSNAKYGKVWLLPYLTRKDKSQQHPDAYTWYDELIISRAEIADPI